MQNKTNENLVSIYLIHVSLMHYMFQAPSTFSLKLDVSSREFELLFLASDNGMIMGNVDPPGKKTEKRKKVVKVERVNFQGSEVWGLADVRWKAGRIDGRREGGRYEDAGGM